MGLAHFNCLRTKESLCLPTDETKGERYLLDVDENREPMRAGSSW